MAGRLYHNVADTCHCYCHDRLLGKEGLQRRLLDIAAGPLPSFMAQSAIIQLLGEDTGAEAAAMPQVQTQLQLPPRL